MPIPLIVPLAMAAAQATAGAISKHKAKKEHEKSYKELMSQDFGATKSAIEYRRNPISQSFLDRIRSQSSMTTGTSMGAIAKGDSRGMGSIGKIQQNAYNQDTNLLGIEQNAYANAMAMMANQEMAGRQFKQNIMAGNVAGMAQREMQAQQTMNSGISAFGKTMMAGADGTNEDWFGSYGSQGKTGGSGFWQGGSNAGFGDFSNLTINENFTDNNDYNNLPFLLASK